MNVVLMCLGEVIRVDQIYLSDLLSKALLSIGVLPKSDQCKKRIRY